MKVLAVLLVMAIVVGLVVIPGLQIYNYLDFKHKLETEILEDNFKHFRNLTDEQAVKTREGLIAAIEKAGYAVQEEDIVFRAYLTGMPRLMSEEIFQITDTGLSKPELRATIEFDYDLLVFSRRAHIAYTKPIKP